MKNFAQQKFAVFIVLLLLVCPPVSAQFADPDEDEDAAGAELEPAAPIDDYILPLLIMGMATGFYFIRKKNQKVGTN